MPKKTTISKIAEILDRTSEGGSFTKIASSSDVDKSTVFKVLEDFPLWGWLRTRGEAPATGRPRKGVQRRWK